MATQIQTTFLQGQADIARQFLCELTQLSGQACRAYGGRKKLDADLKMWRGRKQSYDLLIRLAKLNRF